MGTSESHWEGSFAGEVVADAGQLAGGVDLRGGVGPGEGQGEDVAAGRGAGLGGDGQGQDGPGVGEEGVEARALRQEVTWDEVCP